MASFSTLKRGSIQVQLAAREVTEKLGPRHILVVLVAFGFFLCGVVEQSATVALLANSSTTISAEEFAQYVENTSYITRYCAVNHDKRNNQSTHAVIEKNVFTDSNIWNTSALETEPAGNNYSLTPKLFPIYSVAHIEVPMSLEEETEAIMREAFMWGSFLAPLPASRVAARIGAERLFGYAVLGSALAAMLVPASWLSPVHVALRIVQGACAASSWPAAHMIAVAWFDHKDISTFISCYTAVNLGYAAVGVMGTPLVRFLGPDSLCYVITFVGVLWWIIWWHLVEEPLAPKPKSTKQPGKHDKGVVAYPSLPWRNLLLSGPVWACGVGVLGSQWADATVMLGVFKYLKLVYGYSTNHEHVLAALPHVGHFVAAITFGVLVDHVRASKIVSTTTARKLFCYVSHFLPAAILFVLGYTGCDPTVPAALYTAALVLSAATPAGVFASAVDLAPNFAGTIFGLCQTLGAAGCLAANYVVREGLHGSIAGRWRLVFIVSSMVLLLTASIFMEFGSGSCQDWNTIDKTNEDDKKPKLSADLETISEAIEEDFENSRHID